MLITLQGEPEIFRSLWNVLTACLPVCTRPHTFLGGGAPPLLALKRPLLWDPKRGQLWAQKWSELTFSENGHGPFGTAKRAHSVHLSPMLSIWIPAPLLWWGGRLG